MRAGLGSRGRPCDEARDGIDRHARRRLVPYRGGMMFELGCHVIDLVQLVLGPPEQVTGYRQHVSKENDGGLDNMLAVLTYPRAIASVK